MVNNAYFKMRSTKHRKEKQKYIEENLKKTGYSCSLGLFLLHLKNDNKSQKAFWNDQNYIHVTNHKTLHRKQNDPAKKGKVM